MGDQLIDYRKTSNSIFHEMNKSLRISKSKLKLARHLSPNMSIGSIKSKKNNRESKRNLICDFRIKKNETTKLGKSTEEGKNMLKTLDKIKSISKLNSSELCCSKQSIPPYIEDNQSPTGKTNMFLSQLIENNNSIEKLLVKNRYK